MSEEYGRSGEPLNLVYGGPDFGFNLNQYVSAADGLASRHVVAREIFHGAMLEIMSHGYYYIGSTHFEGQGYLRLTNPHFLFQKFETWYVPVTILTFF